MAIQEYRDIFIDAFRSIENINQYLQPKIPLLMELQLTKRQESIILLYLRSPELNMSMIAEKLGITKSSVSQALNKLEEEDLLHRSINELNRREITLTLGKQGEELHSQFREFEDMIVKNYISKLELEEFQAARDALVKLERIIEKGEKN